MKMYSRYGGIEVSDGDAIAACNAFPHDWTRTPWIRPDGRPDVFIRTDWQTIPVMFRIELARNTYADPDRSIDTAARADQVISEYLAGTRHPTDKAGAP